MNAANTWQFVSVVIPGDTVTFAYGTGNSYGLQVCFNLGTGTTALGTAGSWSGNNYLGAVGALSLVSIAGATFYFTGVQLEVGGIATPFERRQFGTEFALCQRYFQNITSPAMTGVANSTTTVARMGFTLPVPTRVAATSITLNGTITIYDGTSTPTIAALGATYASNAAVQFDSAAFASGTTAANRPIVTLVASAFSILVNAEL